MARRFERLQADAAELDAVAVLQRRERVLRLRGGAQIDRRARAIAQLQMAGDEVGVEVGQERRARSAGRAPSANARY